MTDLSKLGKYEIKRELGRGAFGVVYEAYDPVIDRTVALKTIRPEHLEGEDTAAMRARFRREAQAAGRLSHSNIVAVYDFGEDGAVCYIAMELVHGRELKSHFARRERFSLEDAARIMAQLLDALDYSHRRGVVHRDVKPANVILLADGSLKIADFGIARVESSNLTQKGVMLGTPSYMSPEQFTGQAVDGRSDLFSAGVVLYELLTGERPFTGSPTTIMHKVLKENPLPPSTLNVRVPRDVDAIVTKALAKRPEERFQTGREFADALRAALEGYAGRAAAPTFLTSAADFSYRRGPAEAKKDSENGKPLPSEALPTRSGSMQRRRSRNLNIAILGSVIAIALALSAWLALSFGPSAPAPLARTQKNEPASQSDTTAQSPVPAPVATAPESVPAGTIMITAIGIADPSDARYEADKALLQRDVRADSKGQLVEKALRLYVERGSLAQNYERVREKLLANSEIFIARIVQETEPRLGKDGLVSMTTQGVVNVKAVRKSLEQMSQEERIEFIRTSGDPKIAVRIATRDADLPAAVARLSPVAENVLKERIKRFGFRTWSEEVPPSSRAKTADFAVIGEAQIKKLSAPLPASGLIVTKFALTSWTVKCLDRTTGEEIYYNTTLPKAIGSWASEEEALRVIGTKIADEFSRNFFLLHFNVTGRKVTLKVDGMPDGATPLLAQELVGLPAIIMASARPGSAPPLFDIQLAGAGDAADLVASDIVTPLNAKLGRACFSLGWASGDEVSMVFDPACNERTVLGRLETYPPAALYGAAPARLRSIVKNPETLGKLPL